ENIRPRSEQLAVEPEISVFMALDAGREQVQAVAPLIKRLMEEQHKKAKISFISRESALDDLRNRSGITDVLSTLGKNPLPDSYVLQLEGFDNARDAARIDAIAEQLRTLPGVETVQVDSAWVKKLASLLSILRMGLAFIAATLAVVVVAVVFNTTRLQVMTQLDEIEISQMVGATDAFIHRPFYYTGAALGLCSGVLALAVVALSLKPFNTALAEFARLYASEFQLLPLGLSTSLGMLAISALLGLFGAFLCVKRHLVRIRT
ncbi:MAG: hypothetical protein RL748_1553, partial [Pseudomonadota bacterium]